MPLRSGQVGGGLWSSLNICKGVLHAGGISPWCLSKELKCVIAMVICTRPMYLSWSVSDRVLQRRRASGR